MFGELMHEIGEFVFLEYSVGKKLLNQFLALQDKKMLLWQKDESVRIERIDQIIFACFGCNDSWRSKVASFDGEIIYAIYRKIPSHAIQQEVIASLDFSWMTKILISSF